MAIFDSWGSVTGKGSAMGEFRSRAGGEVSCVGEYRGEGGGVGGVWGRVAYLLWHLPPDSPFSGYG